MLKIANMCPVIQPCSVVACTLLARLLLTRIITSYTDRLLTFTARVNELILDATLNWFSWYHWELFLTFQLISSRFFQWAQTKYHSDAVRQKNREIRETKHLIIKWEKSVYGGYVGNYLAGLRMNEQEDLFLYEEFNLSFLLIFKINSLCRSFNTNTNHNSQFKRPMGISRISFVWRQNVCPPHIR